jgi:hypothetical protein
MRVIAAPSAASAAVESLHGLLRLLAFEKHMFLSSGHL